MFGWLRKCWHGGQVPAKPNDNDLDWPDEEEWVFDYDYWQWVKRAKPRPNPAWDREWEEIDSMREDIPMAVVLEDEPVKCCGGSCKQPPPLPPPNDPIWGPPA